MPRISSSASWARMRLIGAVSVLVAAALFASSLEPQRADGVSTTKFTVSPSPTAPGQPATYTIGTFRAEKGETITQVAVTFPAGCDVTAASAVNPGDTIVSIAGSTVVLQLGTPATPRDTFSIVIGNVRNPTSAGTFLMGNQVVFTLADGTTTSLSLPARQLDFTITDPYISMTITTPGPLQSIQFGTLDPGAASAAARVDVTIDSSAGYLISKSVGGQAALMGLSWTDLPTTAQPAGVNTYSDDFRVTFPWESDPGAYSAAVVYTVVHN